MTDSATPNMQELYTFLGELAQNNNRVWFAQNKERYDRLRAWWIGQLQILIDKMPLNARSRDIISGKIFTVRQESAAKFFVFRMFLHPFPVQCTLKADTIIHLQQYRKHLSSAEVIPKPEICLQGADDNVICLCLYPSVIHSKIAPWAQHGMI